jgi:hypothetical protein
MPGTETVYNVWEAGSVSIFRKPTISTKLNYGFKRLPCFLPEDGDRYNLRNLVDVDIISTMDNEQCPWNQTIFTNLEN